MPEPQPWLQVYQPLIVGLGAVVLGLLGNTALEWIKQELQRSRTARTVRHMIYQELLAARSICEDAAETLEAWGDETSLSIPVYERYPVYDLHLKELGALSGQEIGLIMEAYRYVMAKPETYMHIGRFYRSEERLVVLVPPQHRSVLLDLNSSVLAKIRPATAALRRHLPKKELTD